ncbi:putative transcriptional regulator [Paraburkholderia sp. GAS206C]
MNFLILANVPFDRAQESTASCSSVRSRGSRFLLFDDPARLLEALTVQRMEIVTMLREEGPMTAESIASLQAREKTAVMRDLEALLDLEILDLDRDASYLFGFSGIRVILQFPHRGHKERGA